MSQEIITPSVESATLRESETAKYQSEATASREPQAAESQIGGTPSGRSRGSRPWWLFVVIFIVSQLAAAGVTLAISRPQHGGTAVISGSVVPALFAANALAIVLFMLWRPRTITGRSTLQGLRGRGSRRTALMFLLALPVIVLVNIIQEAFFPEIPDLVGEDTMLAIMHNPLGLLTVAVLGPVAEELLFRGGVQTDLSLRFSHQGWFVPIAFSALLFALIHMNPAQMPVAFILGVVLGFAYWWTGSLVAPILIHVFNNSFACLMGYLTPDDNSIVSLLGGSTGAGLAAVISLFMLFLVLRQVHKEGLESLENS